MKYKVKGSNERTYPRNHIIHKMTDFIIKNKYYFSALCKILDKVINPDQKDLIYSIIDTECLVHQKEMTKTKNSKFTKLVDEFLKEDVLNSGNTRGDFLEYIIMLIGPIHSFDKKMNRVMECIIVDENDEPIGGKKKFDIGFYCDSECIENFQAEFIESKINLNNFLIKRNGSHQEVEVNHRAKDKLDFMKAINDEFRGCDCLITAFATIKFDIDQSKGILERYGYNIIQVYDYNMLKLALLKQSA